ncbi:MULTISPECIES: transcriptional repressor LexA [Crateriforma]|uniref:LexA repressor n=1 Tax=Crateriforma conspicua TaxID=2527996 RepID=A0A5C6FXF5_9PLAN|nr:MULTISPECIES: transcriptional repressor LexA [Crateriforma]QDV64319.1 LexA repressor [Crateriforma conspicua]TWT69712.1 LexA repressor [Crateriforma conspicua]TWU66305.1 LexA repressor [Crateriforma conspicua]
MTTTAQLTERQQNVYDMIRGLIIERGYGPTVREIGEHFGIKSPNGVMCHLRALERKGLITRSPNKSRAIELTSPADRSGHALPMVGVVAAGPTTLAFEQNERVDVGQLLFSNDRFMLQVSGDSMVNAHIADGDYVVIQRQENAQPGQMVVAQTPDGEATLKYWYPEGDRIRLQPANDNMDPIFVREAKILGIAVGVVRTRV